MKVLQNSSQTWLRAAILSNAVFSGGSGILFLLVSPLLAAFIGIGQGGFVFLGINLMVFALMLALLWKALAKPRRWVLVLVAIVIVLDLLWVAGSLGLVSTPSMTTEKGAMGVLGIAAIVGAFALWQLLALAGLLMSRKRNASNATTSNATTSNATKSNTSTSKFTTLPSITGLLLVLFSTMGCGPSDLRTPILSKVPVDRVLENKGRELLMQVAATHGFHAWKQYDTQEVIMDDAWQAKSWWPAQQQKLSLKSIPGTFTAKVTLLDGPETGKELGIQSWKAYSKPADGAFLFEPATEELTAQNFYIPSLQYFNELPFRMLNAERIAYAGERTYRGRTYDLLLVTWGSLDPNPDHDQYLLWIDRETNLVSMCQYTIREATPVFTGTIHFEDYRDVQGVQFPFKQTVILPAPENTLYPLDKYFFHQSRATSVSFDSFDRSELIVDSALRPGDVKLN